MSKKEISPLRTLMRPVLRTARCARLVFFPTQARSLLTMGLVRPLQRSDPLCFINRRHYLSRAFGLRVRIDSVLLHYRHELKQFDDEYHQRVYEGSVLVLWEERVGGQHICVLLVSSGEYRGEGEVSAYLLVNGAWASCMSYSFVDGAMFGLSEEGPILFVTRNQLNPGPELDLFRRCYRNNSPQYFCLAAIAGVVKAHGANSFVAIPCNAQVNYEPGFDAGFRNSYCNFWRQFGARTVGDVAYLLKVPLPLAPLDSVAAKHRARSADRRRRWAAVTLQAETQLRARRRQTVSTTRTPKVWLYSACIASTSLLAEFGGAA